MKRISSTKRTQHNNRSGNSRPGNNQRRGNTIVLVAAILVLLVIIATAYITRTQAGRVTAKASQAAATRVDAADKIAEMIAGEIALNLFTYPVDPDAIVGLPDVQNGVVAANSNIARLDPQRINLFGDLVPYDRYEPDVFFPYNHPPYHTIPFTNPPDASELANLANRGLLPIGPGNSGIAVGSGDQVHLGTGNPFGNPGYGDTRWLRDVEPIRFDGINNGFVDGISHWRHLTNLSRVNNGWRIVRNISDVTGLITDLSVMPVGGLVTDLGLPIEQWPNAVPNGIPTEDNTSLNESAINFGVKWFNWFGGADQSLDVHVQTAFSNVPSNINSAPINMYRLRDIDADGTIWENGERPEDEFNINSLRYRISQVLTDTDGDGYTDAYWHLAPLGMDNGVRHLVAVSIVDNSAMVNANVATAFSRSGNGLKTLGMTPADVALVGENVLDGTNQYDSSLGGNWNVGLYDNPNHERHNAGGIGDIPGASFSYDYDPDNWERHVTQIGFVDNLGDPIFAPDQFERLAFWNYSASKPPVSGRSGLGPWTIDNNFVGPFTPFNIENEIELRLFASQNSEWIFSHYEWSVQNISAGEADNWLRANQGLPETSELGDQLPNRERANDMRQRVTFYSGARNETLPPSLWMRVPTTGGGIGSSYLPDVVQIDAQNFGIDVAETNFFKQSQLKLDLRESRFRDPTYVGIGADPSRTHPPGYMLLRDRLPFAMMMALTDDTNPPIFNNNPRGYYGDVAGALDKHRRLAAAFSANILNYRDADSVAPLFFETDQNMANPYANPDLQQFGRTVTLPRYGTTPEEHTIGYLGMEAQPFLLEAFIAHVHGSEPVPASSNSSGLDQGNYVDNDPLQRTTIVVVQIANPYDFPINLRDYRINVFGEEVDLNVVANNYVTSTEAFWLQPATEEAPRTATFYMIADSLNNPAGPSGGGINTFKSRWIDFLDINPINHPDGTILADVTGMGWVDQRDLYDNPPGGSDMISSVELYRVDRSHPTNATPELVMVDRFGIRADDPGPYDPTDREDEFFVAVTGLQAGVPPDPIPNFNGHVAGIRIRNFNTYVNWARVTRPWGIDPDEDRVLNPTERSPRYIIGVDQAFVLDTSDPNYDGPWGDDPDNPAWQGNSYDGNAYEDFDGDPDSSAGSVWFDDEFEYDEFTGDTRRRKVTYFDHLYAFDGSDRAIYDQQWDTIYYGIPIKSAPDDGPDGDLTDLAEGTYSFPLQMLWRDSDFLQLGEVLNVWLYGHEVEMTVAPTGPNGFPQPDDYVRTVRTFSEHMADEDLVGIGPRINRLQVYPEVFNGVDHSAIIGIGDPNDLRDGRHGMPNLPAGMRVLDLFTLDDGGYTPGDADNDGTFNTPADTNLVRLNLAGNFEERLTPGLININTASVPAMRSLPHMYKAVNEYNGIDVDGTGPYPGEDSQSIDQIMQGQPNRDWTRVMIPEAIMQYRDGYPQVEIDNGNLNRARLHGHFNGPDYSNREDIVDLPELTTGLRDDRGMATPAEMLLLRSSAAGDIQDPYTGMFSGLRSWAVDFGSIDSDLPLISPPFRRTNNGAAVMPMTLSTDVTPTPRANHDYTKIPSVEILNGLDLDWDQDPVAGDVEEANLLYSGASNLMTARSDVFTVYFRIRSITKDPVTGRWNALDKDSIVDDTRYVMLVDRSNVNQPGDKPKIIYIEKLPN